MELLLSTTNIRAQRPQTARLRPKNTGPLRQRVYGRDGLVQVRFRHARDAQQQRADGQFGNQPPEARQGVALEHGAQLGGRAGQQHQDRAGFLQPLAGRSAAVVRQISAPSTTNAWRRLTSGMERFDLHEPPLISLGDLRVEDQLPVVSALFAEPELAPLNVSLLAPAINVVVGFVLGGRRPLGGPAKNIQV